MQTGAERARVLHGFPFRQVVVIGDTPLDVAAARQCGYRSVASPRNPAPQLRDCGADLVLEDPDLLPVLLAWHRLGTTFA